MVSVNLRGGSRNRRNRTRICQSLNRLDIDWNQVGKREWRDLGMDQELQKLNVDQRLSIWAQRIADRKRAE